MTRAEDLVGRAGNGEMSSMARQGAASTSPA
jgi:hypothetical protein